MAETTANLIENRQVTVALLANPLDWRVRVVEEIVVDTATTCLRRRSLQAGPLRAHIGATVPGGVSHALLALYVAPIRRGPLLDFDIAGPDGDGWLLPRLEIAERQALYLEGVAAASGNTVSRELHTLLSAVCGFTGEILTKFQDDVPLGEYLEAGLGRQVADVTLRTWEEIGDACRTVLRPRLDVFRGYSAPENPALVLPELFAADEASSDDQATDLLIQYRDLLVAMDRRAETPDLDPAGEFLVAIADYANYYDLMVAMRVPLDEPFLVKFAERRDHSLSLFGNRGTQELVVADAQTNHVTFKVPDPNVRIRDFRAVKPDSNDYSFGAFQSRQDSQNRAFYAHDPDRDFRVRLSFQLGLLRRLQVVPYLVAFLLTLLILALLIERPTDLRTLGLTVGAAALAASVLLAREPSTLGSRLRLVSSLALAGLLLILVGVSGGLYVSGLGDDQAEPGVPAQTETPTPTPTTARPTTSGPPITSGGLASPRSTVRTER